jgi:hypothetical protein
VRQSEYRRAGCQDIRDMLFLNTKDRSQVYQQIVCCE